MATYFCYVFLSGRDTPHFEAVDGECLAEAERLARRLMTDRPAARQAEIWLDDTLVERLAPATPAAVPSPA